MQSAILQERRNWKTNSDFVLYVGGSYPKQLFFVLYILQIYALGQIAFLCKASVGSSCFPPFLSRVWLLQRRGSFLLNGPEFLNIKCVVVLVLAFVEKYKHKYDMGTHILTHTPTAHPSGPNPTHIDTHDSNMN